MAVVVAPLLTAGFLATGVGPARAATSLNLITTGSPNSTVGYGIFANVNLMNAGVTPSGLATFRLYGPSDPSCTAPIFTSTQAVTSTSVNSAVYVTNQAGTYRWTTSYGGDANYYGASPTLCSSLSADVIVAKARTFLKVTASAPFEGTISASATLTGGYAPNGTITFFLTGPNVQWCSGTPVFTAAVQVNGAGTYSSPDFDPPASGTYTWRTNYSGDANSLGTSITACTSLGNSVTV